MSSKLQDKLSWIHAKTLLLGKEPSQLRWSSYNSILIHLAHWTILKSSILYFRISFDVLRKLCIKCWKLISILAQQMPFEVWQTEKYKLKLVFLPKIPNNKILMRSILDSTHKTVLQNFYQISQIIIVFYS